MLSHLRPAFFMLIIMTVLTGLIYPLAITGIGQVAFSNSANGSLISKDNTVVGSHLIGQAWTSDKYFWGRPSAAGKGYDAAASSGSNLGSTSKALIDRINGDIQKLRQSGETAPLPADSVTASGSGLDPHISPQYANLQIARVAKARGIAEEKVKAVVLSNTQNSTLGLFGEPRLNVLLLNLALDGLSTPTNG